MITKLSHAVVYVTDHDVAYDFYVTKLGLEVRTDAKMDNGFRWLTVGSKTQPDLEIVLMLLAEGPAMDAETAGLFRTLLERGAMGCGVLEVDDCRATYNDLVSKGVTFRGEPTEQFYGVEALMVDPFGNWFSMTEHPKG